MAGSEFYKLQINLALQETLGKVVGSVTDLRKAVKEGYKQAVRDLAVHKNGELLVGAMARPLAEVLAEIEES